MTNTELNYNIKSNIQLRQFGLLDGYVKTFRTGGFVKSSTVTETIYPFWNVGIQKN